MDDVCLQNSNQKLSILLIVIMNLSAQILLSLADTLERQNAAIKHENEILHRELESLKQENKMLEKYYHIAKQSKEQINMMKIEIDRMKQQSYLAENIRKYLEQQIRQKGVVQEQLHRNYQKISIIERELALTQQNSNKQKRDIEQYTHLLEQTEKQMQKMQNKMNTERTSGFNTDRQTLSDKQKMTQVQDALESCLKQLALRQQTIQQMQAYISDLEKECIEQKRNYTSSLKMIRRLEGELHYQKIKSQNELSSLKSQSSLHGSIPEHSSINQKSLSGNQLNFSNQYNFNHSNRLNKTCVSQYPNSKQSSSPQRLQARLKNLRIQNDNLLNLSSLC